MVKKYVIILYEIRDISIGIVKFFYRIVLCVYILLIYDVL